MSKSFFLFLLIFGCVTQAFAKWSDPAYEAELPLMDGERVLGEIKVKIQGQDLLWIEKESFVASLKASLNPATFESLQNLTPQFSPDLSPIQVAFNPENLWIEAHLKMDERITEKIGVQDDPRSKYKAQALHPAPLGGALNYRLEQNLSNAPNQSEYFGGQFDSFINFKSLVLENQSYYQSDQTSKWYRGDLRLVKDFEKQQIRVQAGDVYPQVQGFMVARPLGGINFAKNFTLNPYRLPYPTGVQSFTLESRSFVKYFVNGSLIKSEFLPAGNYTARDIPLNNGLNTITIEATDDLGQKRIFVFRSSASINLLNEGESRYDLSYGRPFLDNSFNRDYLDQGELFSGFFQYGFLSSFSASAYVQTQENHALLGSDLIQATPIGNFTLGHARSRHGEREGGAQSLGHQLVGRSLTFATRYEHRMDDFRASLFDLRSSVKNNYGLNLTLPVSELFTVSLGGNYGDVRDNRLTDRYGIDGTLNLRIFQNQNLSFFISRNRDEFQNWNDVAYVFLTISFPGKNDFVSVFYDQQQKASKLSYIKDNQNRLYHVRSQGTISDSPDGSSGELDLLYPTPFADFGTRMRSTYLKDSETVVGNGSARLHSAFVFAYQDEELHFGVSRPVANSFALFKPEASIKDQRIALKSTSAFTEAQSGLFGEITYSNLLAYQYRELQFDPSWMDEGRSLKKEKFVLYPTYRSAHLIKLEDKGSVVLHGRLLYPDGAPVALQVGEINGQSFFTNRDGAFFIEGIEPGSYQLKLDEEHERILIKVSEDSRGMSNVGELKLEARP